MGKPEQPGAPNNDEVEEKSTKCAESWTPVEKMVRKWEKI
jgi:hypothetical protein